MKTPNTMLAYRAPVAALWFGVALANAQIEDPNASYIVQGPELEAVQTAVTAAGGRVTHELAVINGVAALLSDAQVSRLEAQSNLRLTPDNRLSLDSTTGSEVRFSRNKLYWTLTNGSSHATVLEALNLSWPAANGAIKKIKLDGDEIHDEKLEPEQVVVGSGSGSGSGSGRGGTTRVSVPAGFTSVSTTVISPVMA